MLRVRSDLFECFQELPRAFIFKCVAVVQQVAFGRVFGCVQDDLIVLLLLCLLLDVLVSVVLENLLVRQLRVNFDAGRFLSEFFLL